MSNTTKEFAQPIIVYPEMIELIEKLFVFQSEGKGTVFIDFSGHVGLITVRIYPDHWVTDSQPSFREEAYISPTTEVLGRDPVEELKSLCDKVYNYITALP